MLSKLRLRVEAVLEYTTGASEVSDLNSSQIVDLIVHACPLNHFL